VLLGDGRQKRDQNKDDLSGREARQHTSAPVVANSVFLNKEESETGTGRRWQLYPNLPPQSATKRSCPCALSFAFWMDAIEEP